MQSIREYCDKYNRDPSNNFAKACYENRSIDQLKMATFNDPDHSWISITEWSDAIEAALNQKLWDSLAELTKS